VFDFPPQRSVADLQAELAALGYEAVPCNKPGPLPEMALATSPMTKLGSTTTTVKGVLSIRNSSDAIVGMGFRTSFQGQHFMVTAKHVWDQVCKGGDTYKVEHRGKCVSLVLSKISLVFCSSIGDQVCVTLPDTTWSILSCKSLKCTLPLTSHRASLHGYDKGELVVSHGIMNSRPEEPFIFSHYASSLPGFSGSPLILGNNVVGIHLGVDGVADNYAAACMWLVFHGEKASFNESEVPYEARAMQYVDELPAPKPGHSVKRSKVVSFGYALEIATVGKMVKIEKVVARGHNHMTMEDVLDDYFADFPDHTVQHESNFPRGGSPSQTQLRVVKASPSPARTSPPFIVGGDTPGKKEKSSPMDLASNTSELARLRAMEQRQHKIVKFLNEQHNLGRRLQSGVFPQVTLPLNESPSSPRPVNTRVLMVLMTRRQEKLYNLICRTRKFQEALKGRSPDQVLELWRRLRVFVTSSTTPLKGNPHLDFLSTL